MSEDMDTVVEGDHVRVVLEGRVTYASEDWVSIADEHGFDPGKPKGLSSVTKLSSPPLPTTPGSVILEGRRVFYLGSSGWRGTSSDLSYLPTEFIRLDNVTILYDAGAVT